ncbi:MAG TPA: hypothetical protein VFV50_19485 [Bdellovibrionales bacterium]|nr:hypothetical protein [Bdellovibrionales bacterium]
MAHESRAQFASPGNWSSKRGYFIQSSAGTTGNFGGLNGANSYCHTQVTGQVWKGKSEAGTLTPARVRAFLCDSSTCQNPLPNTIYIFASAGDSTKGGALFKTDGSGSGPQDAAVWSAATHFGYAGGHWTGPRNVGTATHWGTTSTGAANNSCLGWASGTGGDRGFQGDPTMSNSARWVTGANAGCNTSYYVICIVDPI